MVETIPASPFALLGQERGREQHPSPFLLAMRSTADIQAELDLVNDAITALVTEIKTRKGVASYSVGGRQVSSSASLDYTRLTQQRKMLELELSRADRGGIRVRAGVVRG